MLVMFGFLPFFSLANEAFGPDRTGSTKDLAVILAGPLLPAQSRRKMEGNAGTRSENGVAM